MEGARPPPCWIPVRKETMKLRLGRAGVGGGGGRGGGGDESCCVVVVVKR